MIHFDYPLLNEKEQSTKIDISYIKSYRFYLKIAFEDLKYPKYYMVKIGEKLNNFSKEVQNITCW